MQLTADQSKAVAAKLLLDDQFFFKRVLPEHFPMDVPPFHQEILDAVNKNKPKTAITAPRGHAKTTLLSLGYVVKQIAFKKVRFVILISESYSQAVLNLEAIKDVIEYSEYFQYFFGQIKNPDKWSEGEIETTTGIKIMAKGSRQRIRGLKWGPYRPDLVILDDFESEGNTDTKEARDKLKRWITGAVLPSLDPKGRAVMVGTIVHEEAFLNSVQTNPFWETLFFECIRDGKPLWPERFTAQKIEEIKQDYIEQGMLDMFFQEYYNKPTNPEDSLFLSSDILYYSDPVVKKGDTWCLDTGENLEPLAIFTGVDPALGKARGDNTVLCTIGVTKENQIYVLELIAKKLNPLQTMEAIFSCLSTWGSHEFCIETNAYQEALVTFTREESRKRNVWPAIVEMKSTLEKGRKLSSMQPRFRTHSVHLRNEHTQLAREALSFRPEKKDNKDDCLDALYNAIHISQPAKAVAFKDGEPVVVEFNAPMWATL